MTHGSGRLAQAWRGKSGCSLLIAAWVAHPGPASAIQSVPRWRVDSTPLVRIASDERANRLFSAIQVVRSPLGEVVVLDTRAREMSAYSSHGEVHRMLARPGGGPGEFTSSHLRLVRFGDSLFVLEGPPGPSQVHAFVLPRGFVSRKPLRSGNGPLRAPSPMARFATGQLLVSTGGFRVLPNVAANAVFRDSINLGILDPDGDARNVALGWFAANSRVGYALASIPGQVGVADYRFAPSLVFEVSGDQLWLGDAPTGAIRILTASGELVRSTTVPPPPRSFSRERLERARERALRGATSDDERSRVAATFRPALLPATVPAFTRFVRGPDGEMWIELFEEDDSLPNRFVVLNRQGRMMARVSLPTRMRLDDVGPDYVAGVVADDLDRQQAVVCRLWR